MKCHEQRKTYAVYHLFVESKKYNRLVNTTKRNRLTDTGNRLVGRGKARAVGKSETQIVGSKIGPRMYYTTQKIQPTFCNKYKSKTNL